MGIAHRVICFSAGAAGGAGVDRRGKWRREDVQGGRMMGRFPRERGEGSVLGGVGAHVGMEDWEWHAQVERGVIVLYEALWPPRLPHVSRRGGDGPISGRLCAWREGVPPPPVTTL